MVNGFYLFVIVGVGFAVTVTFFFFVNRLVVADGLLVLLLLVFCLGIGVGAVSRRVFESVFWVMVIKCCVVLDFWCN